MFQNYKINFLCHFGYTIYRIGNNVLVFQPDLCSRHLVKFNDATVFRKASVLTYYFISFKTNKIKMADTKKTGGLEMTTFKLETGKTYNDFIAANADVDLWLKKQPGFQSRFIARQPDGTIIDALVWDSEADGISAMHRLMTELASSPVHDVIDQATVSWNIYPVYHQI